MSRGGEMARHREAHHAQADEGDVLLFAHECVLSIDGAMLAAVVEPDNPLLRL